MTPHIYKMGTRQMPQKMILRIDIQQTLTLNVRSFVALVAAETRMLYLVISTSFFLQKDFYVMYGIPQMMNRAEYVVERSLLHHQLSWR